MAGMIFTHIAEKSMLPRITVMLLAGIIIGSYYLNLIDTNVLNISSDIRKIALIMTVCSFRRENTFL